MKNEILPEDRLDEELLAGRRWIDVRAPSEFQQGHLPGAINLPILTDEERHRVGLAYKTEGPEAATALGHQLVAGEVKRTRVRAWREFADAHGAAIYCFRGGLRSQIARRWIEEDGGTVPLLKGGYKSARTRLLRHLERWGEVQSFLVVTGPSGSGKTELLRELGGTRAVLDLENRAAHRGSVFGAVMSSQPAQAVFENDIALDLLRAEKGTTGPVLVEDESWMIGQCRIPASIYGRMALSPMIAIEEPLHRRVERIFIEYVRGPRDRGVPVASLYDGLQNGVRILSRRLGGVRTVEILEDLEKARRCALQEDVSIEVLETADRPWIEKLLRWYYDPIYQRRLDQCAARIVARGDYHRCLETLRSSRSLSGLRAIHSPKE